MAIITLEEMKAHLNWTDDLGTDDDALITRQIEAAQGLIETHLGHEIEATYDPVPAPLQEAVAQLAAHFYENREAVVTGTIATELPWGVGSILDAYRDRSF